VAFSAVSDGLASISSAASGPFAGEFSVRTEGWSAFPLCCLCAIFFWLVAVDEFSLRCWNPLVSSSRFGLDYSPSGLLHAGGQFDPGPDIG